jgi:uncharacterized NAD(P)/FAD-binding protein YdhS
MKSGARVVILGGGASGTLLAVQLLRGAGAEPLEVVVVERSATVGRGVAYGTTCPAHLLNAPAGAMSGLCGDDAHLVRWLRQRSTAWCESSFVPRQLYGDYLADLLETARAETRPSMTFRRLRGEAVAVEDADRPVVRLADGTSLLADRVIVAVGNQPSVAVPGGPGLTRYIGDPWDRDRLTSVAPGDHVAIAGSGLTAVDTILTLRDNGHKGRITAVSRRGLLPYAHEPDASKRPWDLSAHPDTDVSTARGLLRMVRTEVTSSAHRGSGWRSVIDALRPATPALWQRLPVDEQRRFRRHLARVWEVHRHRMAPDVAATITDLERRGRLEVERGRVVRVEQEGYALRVLVDGGVNRAMAVDWLANCTGPPASLEHSHEPLLLQMQAEGLLCPHPSGVGAAATSDGGILGADGRRISWLWAVGPLLRGTLWEVTAIPEIRDQTAQVASLVIDSL